METEGLMQQIKIGKILSIIVAALLMMGNTYGSLGQQDLSSVDQRRLLLVSIPGLSFQEIDELHGFGWEQLLRGRVAAMNVRTPERGIEDVYLSVGSGAPAVAWTHTQAMMSDEQVGTVLAKDMVVRYTGRTIAGEIVIPTWVEMKQFNENLANSALPGLLGETLKRANIARYVLGNRDQVFLPENNEQAIFRHAPLLLADLHGEVSYGLIGQAANMTNDLRPHGLQTNYEALLHALEESDDRAVIVVELGDLDRLYAEKGRMSQKQFLQMKHVVLQEMGEFLELLMHEHLRQTDELWVLSTMSYAVARQGKSLLTPFFQLGEAGELTSGTTRQAGLISYIDLSVSILDWFGLSVPETMRGQTIQSVQEESTLADTLIKVDEIEYVYKLRPKLIYPLVTYQMLVLLLGLAFLLWRAKFSSKMMLFHHKVRYLHKVICALLYSAVLAPFVLLFVGPWRQIDQTILIFLFYLFIISVSWLLSRFPVVGTLSLIGFVTAGGILLDGSRSEERRVGKDGRVGGRCERCEMHRCTQGE